MTKREGNWNRVETRWKDPGLSLFQRCRPSPAQSLKILMRFSLLPPEANIDLNVNLPPEMFPKPLLDQRHKWQK